MPLTEKGTRLLGIIKDKRIAEEAAALEQERAEAISWARKRAELLVIECRRSSLGTTVEIIGLANREPSRAEHLKIKALEHELGMILEGVVPIDHSVYASESGMPPFAMSITLGELLKLLEGS